MIVDLLQALQQVWNNSTALTSVFGSLYLSRAADANPFPFAVVDLLEGQDAEFSTLNDALVYRPIQINVFAPSLQVTAAGVDNIRAAFDFIQLPLQNSGSVIVQYRTDRVFRQDQTVWHGYVKYLILTEETVPRY